MKKRLLSAIVTLVTAISCLPVQYAMADTNNPNIIYANDFEDGNAVGGEDLTADGGWELDSDNCAGVGIEDGNYAFYPAWAPGKASGKNQWYLSAYYLPESYRTRNGKYVLSLDYYMGSKTNNDIINLCAEPGNYIALPELRYNVELESKIWYSFEIEIDTEADTYDFTILNEDGVIVYAKTGEYTYDLVRCFDFEVRGSGNISGSDYAEGYASKVDNFSVAFFPQNKTTIYTNDFEDGEAVGGEDLAADGGWELDTDDCAGVGIEAGNYAFYPAWAPGKASGKNQWYLSAYYLPVDYRTKNGKYVLSLDYYMGSETYNNIINLCAEPGNYIALPELRYNVKLESNIWYNFKIEIDTEADTYDFTIFNDDGVMVYAKTGEYTYDLVRCFDFEVKGGSNKAGADYVEGYASKVDNMSVSFYEDIKLEPQEPIEITSVDMEEYEGKAWDVVINDFNGANIYQAVFTDNDDIKKGEIGLENIEADGGSIAFAIFLHTKRAEVDLDIVAE